MKTNTKQLTSEQKKYIKKFCYKYRITEEQYFGREWIFGIVEIFESKIPEGFNPKIGGDLLLDVKEISVDFFPVVTEDLALQNLEKISGKFNPVVGRGLYMDKIKKLPENFNITVGGSMSLNSLEELPKNFNPMVGDSLYLGKFKEPPKNFNPKVGGEILYNYNPIHCMWDSGYSFECTSANKPPKILSWQNEKYILLYKMFKLVVWKKNKIYKLKNVYDLETFLVNDKKGNYATGFTIKEAKKKFYQKTNQIKNYKLKLKK